jgi:hypothetical protein
MILGDRSTWPTLQDSKDAGLFIFGICSSCHGKHEADMSALIAKHGATLKTRDVMDKTVCEKCGGKVPVSLVPTQTSDRRSSDKSGQD